MDVVELVTEIETVGDYGMQVEEVKSTFHVQGKCVGCILSKDSWCSKHGKWGYAITDCNAPPNPKKTDTVSLEIKPAVKRAYGGNIASRIECIETGEMFESAKLLAELLDVSESAICNCCRGRSITVRGKQYRYEGDMTRQLLEHARKQPQYNKRSHSTIPVYDRLTRITYKSCAEAAEKLGCGKTTIYRHLSKDYGNINKRFEYVEVMK